MKYSLILLFFVNLVFLQRSYAQPMKTGAVIDTSITGFHFAVSYSGTMVYTQHGPADINGHGQPTAFSVTVSSKATFDEAQAQLMQLLKMSMGHGIKIAELKEKDTVVNTHHAYYISYTETLDKPSYQNLVFNGVIQGDGAVLLFTSGDLDRGKFIELFKRTFFQLRF